MTDNRLLDLVDAHEFRTLFIDELGWDNPDRPPLTLEIDGTDYTLNQVAGYKGLRIWHCPVLPPRPVQRQIDVLVGKDNLERLVIFTDEHRQEWRWPRRKQLASSNAKLVVHQYHNGDRTTHLADRLQAIELDFDEDLPLVTLLDRMRDAFDREAETASVAAARLMGTLYTHLESAGVGEHDATLLLARLLFLLFGDDADMWRPPALFENHLRNHTSAETLHTDLIELFEVLNTPVDRRTVEAGSPLSFFRYINGGLFEDPLRLPQLKAEFRGALLEACSFNWSVISPAVFGSMFQTVKSREARRHGGEHYTTEQNILKTIEPLFLDEYRARLDRAWDDKGQLTKLHNELGQLRFLDPACGCGNFLIVAYRELRALELDLLKRRRDLDMEAIAAGKKVERAQLSLDVTANIRVTLDHFFGIEIEEWPARIAETAMLLVDHLANQQMAEEFGESPDRLPITIAPTIVHANALRVDWNKVVPASPAMVVFGNPPYAGKKQRTAQQTADMQHVWGTAYSGEADYVTSWFTKAVDYFGDIPGQWAFVSTNSMAQGVVVAPVFGYLFARGWHITFAHRTFAWSSEALGQAVVHCVIIGMSNRPARRHRLFEYPTPTSQPIELDVPTINAYLVDGPNVLVTDRRRALNPQLDSDIRFGSMAADGRQTTDDVDSGGLLVKHTDYTELDPSDTVAAKYLRPFVGARELLHGTPRWCIWIPDDELPTDVANSPFLQARIEHVRHFRSEVAKDVGVRAAAATPWRFNRVQQPTSTYLCIPRHVSENYQYYPAARFDPDVISGDHNFVVDDPDGFFFALISSSMFLTWQKTVGGRIKSDPRFASTYTWNTLPLPTIDTLLRDQIIYAGQQVLAARALHPSRSLADHYSPDTMDPKLAAAHQQLDRLVDSAFGATSGCDNQLQRQEILFARYAELIA